MKKCVVIYNPNSGKIPREKIIPQFEHILKKYDYECFHVFNEQLESQYNAMPDCFKNIYSLDEKGELYIIRDPAEVSKSWKEFRNE